MSSPSFASNIHLGAWNYLGHPTITLTFLQSTVLVSLLAVLTTHTATRSFKLLRLLLFVVLKPAPGSSLAIILTNTETDLGFLLPHVFRLRPLCTVRNAIIMWAVVLHAAIWLVAGVAVAFVVDQNDAMVQSKGQECGYWVPPGRSVVDVMRWQQQQIVESEQAKTYVRLCYSDDDSSDRECRRTARKKIDFLTREEDRESGCPWPGGMCRTKPFTLDTGLQSAATLGTNFGSENEIKWQKRMTCAPLPLNSTFKQLRPKSGERGEDVTHYLFGSIGLLSNDTSSHWVSTYETAAGALQLNVQTSTPWIGNGSLQLFPIPPLVRSDGDLTLLFIQANALSFYGRSDDPVFPAHHFESDFMMPGFETITTYRSEEPATALGCFEQMRVCDGHELCSQWTATSITPASPPLIFPSERGALTPDAPAVILTRILISASNLYRTLIPRGVAALAFNDNIYAGSIRNVSSQQWHHELMHLFSVSLAATQLQAVKFGRESYRQDRDGLVNMLPDEIIKGKDNICRMVVWNELGYANVSVSRLAVVLAVAVGMIIVSFSDRIMVKRWCGYGWRWIERWKTEEILGMVGRRPEEHTGDEEGAGIMLEGGEWRGIWARQKERERKIEEKAKERDKETKVEIGMTRGRSWSM